MKSGDQYLEKKKIPEAIIEYRNATQATPKSAAAHYKLAEAYISQNDFPQALTEYLRAGDLDPSNSDAQLRAGNLFMLSSRFNDAQTLARKILTRDPKNTSALLMLGNSLAGLRQLDEALAANEHAVSLDPTQPSLYINLGSLQFIDGKRAEAEATFRKAIAIAPNSVEARLGLANYFWAAGRMDDAIATAQEGRALDPSKGEPNRLIASLLLDAGRPGEAETYFKQAADLSKSVQARLALADYYVLVRRGQQALTVLEDLAKDEKAFAPAMLRIAVIKYVGGDRDAASQVLEQVLKKEPQNANALAFRAHVRLADHDLIGAQADADSAVAADPRSTRAYFARAKVFEVAGRLDDAAQALTQVLQLDGHAAEAEIELVRFHLSRQHIETAIQYAHQAVTDAPRYLEAHLALVRALSVRNTDWPAADAEIRALLRSFPQSAAVRVASGGLALAKGQERAAQGEFARATTLDPQSYDALSRLITLDIKLGDLVDAKTRVDGALASSPKSSQYLMLAGKVYAIRNANDEAEAYLKQAIEADPSNFEAYVTLAEFYLVQQRLVEAREQFIALATKQPKSLSPATMVGILYDVAGDPTHAAEWYEKALAIDGHGATAANNLAWIYAERGQHLELALELAQVANQQLPNQPEVADTLAWVYIKRDQVTMAIPLLEKSIAADPRRAAYRYHLGVAYATNREDAKARASLELAIRLAPTGPEAADAMRVLKTLAY